MKKIFLIEDTEELRRMYTRALELSGFEVEVASDGREALEKLSRMSVPPAVVLLDVIIPEVSGIDVLRKIREHDDLKSLPVIILTNSFVSENAALFLSLGANMYITKLEHDIDYIIKKVNECISGACVMSIADIGKNEPVGNKYAE